MFYKPAIDFLWCPAALAPIEHELGPDRFSELHIDIRLNQNIQRICTGLPIPSKGRRGAHLERQPRRLLLLPAPEYMLPELSVDLSSRSRYEAALGLANGIFWDAVIQCEELY